MKVLFDHHSPFFLAHGGFQLQIEQTKAALGASGVAVDAVRWWDPSQKGDIIHFFGRPSGAYIDFAHKKGMRVVFSELLTALGSRSGPARFVQKLLMRAGQLVLPAAFTSRLAWDAFARADAIIALTTWEAFLFENMFRAPKHKIICIENGVEEVFFASTKEVRGPWLVCTATITERKRVLELARAAVIARTPLRVIGKPYSERDSYGARFLEFTKAHSDLIRYDGPIEDRGCLARAYREARGFVLLSTMESLSLSALEAAACECPLLLSDLPWARAAFPHGASFCPIAGEQKTAAALAQFYKKAPEAPLPPKPRTWVEIANQLKSVYERLLSNSP